MSQTQLKTYNETIKNHVSELGKSATILFVHHDLNCGLKQAAQIVEAALKKN